MAAETLEFQVEARQLLQLMIHSIYSNKDVFLRELISNASDALDKLRIAHLRGDAPDADLSDLHIRITADPKARTLTVSDNGIGMTRDEVVSLIGTIADSGTAAFLRELEEAKDPAAAEALIGKFGVGFYSAFMVADKVVLTTRRAGRDEEGTVWTSEGEGTYTIDSAPDAPQGTSITLHLKPEDAENKLHDYTASWKIRELVKRYSDFITWPIRTPKADGEGDETINSMTALWARPRDEVDDADYNELYKHISHDWSDPLRTIRLQAEGTFEYQALLFLPAKAPHDLNMVGHRRGLQLYVKRVFIMEDCDELLPDYLRFVKGVVDAADLSLNVSREILQQDRQIRLIQRRLTKKVLTSIKEMMTADPEAYRGFWNEFGAVVKEGLLNDFDNRDLLLGIATFASTRDDEPTTLAAYRERMPEEQKHIYYLTGDSPAALAASPHLEAFRARGIEVLLLTDPVDAVWTGVVGEVDGVQLRSVTEADVPLPEKDGEKKDEETNREAYGDLLTWMKETLKDDVKDVRLSSRLTDSPACLVTDNGDLPPALERVYRAMGQDLPATKRILELNPDHPLITGLREAHGESPDDSAHPGTARLLLDLALLAEGGEPTDRPNFVRLVTERLQTSLRPTGAQG